MKKIICLLLTLSILLSFATTAFALYGNPGTNENIKSAIAAIEKAAETNYAYNGITKEQYLDLVRSYVPASTGVHVELAPTGHFFRSSDATEEKEGKATAAFSFYWNLKDADTQRYDLVFTEYITFKIEKLAPGAAAEKEVEKKTSKFKDVTADSYYLEAINWAVDEGITSGTSETTFSPDDTCTKAQIITFLWRSAGSPKQVGKNPFSDVKATDYYYLPALWAYNEKIVTGEKFEGDTPCTRAATVTYIWKSEGGYKLKPISRFTDVPTDSDFALAVAWAVGKKITSGTSDTTFSPDDTCTRGQIATFLYRNVKNEVKR